MTAKVFGVLMLVFLGGFIVYELYALIRNVITTVKERKKKNVSTASETSESQDKSNKEV